MKRWKDNNRNWRTSAPVAPPEKLIKTASGRYMTKAEYSELRKQMAKKRVDRWKLERDIIKLWNDLRKTDEYCGIGYPALVEMIAELRSMGGSVTLT